MDIDIYFENPGEIPSDVQFLPEADSFRSNLKKENYNVALIGVKSELHSSNKGCALAPDAIRKHLYGLRGNFDNVRVCDLGNIRKGNKDKDMFFALKDIIAELSAKKIIPVVIGGSQDFSVPVFEGLKENLDEVNISVVDSRIDISKDVNSLAPFPFLNQIIDDEKLSKLDLLGYQSYYSSDEQLQLLKDHNFFGIRLGALRGDLGKTEPIFRDCDFLSFDIASIRQSDAPGNSIPSPNGLFGEEACQLARFAGFSDRIASFGMFEVNPYFDNNDQTSALAAQVIWHFVEALNNRYGDYPVRAINTYQKYIIPDMTGNDEMVFYHNNLNNRWWIEIPTKKGKRIYSCSYEDYRYANSNQIPEIWMKYYMK
jgi:arginase family enzyme